MLGKLNPANSQQLRDLSFVAKRDPRPKKQLSQDIGEKMMVFFMADSQLGPCHRAPAPPGRLIPPPRNQRKACAAGQDVQHQQDMATGI